MFMDERYRLIFLFFFDERKADLKVKVQRIYRRRLSILIDELSKVHDLDLPRLRVMLSRLHHRHEEFLFSIHFFENVLGLGFSRDVRCWVPPLLKHIPVQNHINTYSSPKEVAEMIFSLNYCQARDRY